MKDPSTAVPIGKRSIRSICQSQTGRVWNMVKTLFHFSAKGLNFIYSLWVNPLMGNT